MNEQIRYFPYVRSGATISFRNPISKKRQINMRKFIKITGVVTVLLVGLSFTFLPDNNRYFEIAKNLEIFTNMYKELNTYYVDDVDPGKLMRTGIEAMVESLDPYTNYISESDIEGYRYLTEGRYNGIGAQSRKIGEYVTITELYKGQPADLAGLRPGDQILAVDGQSAKSKSTEELNEFLRGFPGTEVTLTIRRPGRDQDLDIRLTRGEVEVPNVPYYGVVRDDVGYVALTTFTRDAGRNVANAVKKMKSENPDLKGVILDLRGNGGGLLSEAVNISNIFIPKDELVVTTKGKVKEWDRSFNTMTPPVDTDIPVAVLIDSRSASASEIVSGVIQDYDRGVLVGQRSYGKGLVQNTRDIGYNAKLKLTTAKYYIPSGRCIQSVQYEGGEPVHIPDDQRTPFKTQNGRTVLDGGGVKPDLLLNEPADDPIIKAIEEQNLIFDYATRYVLEHDSISNVSEFHFEDFDQFVQFVEERGFNYETESEKLVKKLQAKAAEEQLDVTEDLEKMEAKILAAKRTALNDYRETLIDLIEKEVASRYYYRNGRIQIGLRNDREIEEAVSLLKDTARYRELLGF